VIQVDFRPENASEQPYRDSNGIVIVETPSLPHLFEEYAGVRVAVNKEERQEQQRLNELSRNLQEPHHSTIEKFIDDPTFRADVLGELSTFSIHLIAGFVSFLERCIEEASTRARPRGAFYAYDQNLTMILDILTAFPVERFPPALFQTAGYALHRVASYVGPARGQSWDAQKTWENRKSELNDAVLRELRNLAKQHRYEGILQLLGESEHTT
jgi:hypothetical protein